MVRPKIVIALLALMLSTCVSAKSTARPSHFGLALTYPDDVPQFFAESNVPYYRLERLVTIILDIDENGNNTGVMSESSSDSAFVTYTQAWFETIKFEPAMFGGKKVSSRLPVILQFRPRVRFPDIFFPVDSTGAVIDADLYFKAFGLNDIRLPRIEEFPRYFCDLKWSDTSLIFKYALTKLALDESGRVTDIQEVSSTFPAFTSQIMSAILWADFSPAVVLGTPVPAECFVLISFFPQISYPAPVWRRSDIDSLPPLERFRVRLLPDTVGLLSKPLPSKVPGDEFALAGKHTALRDTVSAVVRIDTTGHASLGRTSKARKGTGKAVHQVAAQLRFFPALDYQGHPHSFSGLVSFIFQASSKIRIVYHWLPDD